ncbi:MAG: purine-nucleoside phosphorylase [Gemmataceae bacterium]
MSFAQLRQLPRPRAAIVLGSGLGTLVNRLNVQLQIPYAELPNFPRTSVHGHAGQLAYGTWQGLPVVLFRGRAHFYEGHPWPAVTAGVALAADLGAELLILTNASGGLHPNLNPGDLLWIRHHRKLLNATAWPNLGEAVSPNPWEPAPKWLDFPSGTYAALTGPCYETPAEIRALLALGVDAVGMSTAMEAEAGHARGMRVAGISCITNKAAGLVPGALNHAEVLANAAAPADRIGHTLDRYLVEQFG